MLPMMNAPVGAPFLPFEVPTAPVQSRSLVQRFRDSDESRDFITRIERGEFTEADQDRAREMIMRGVTSTMTAFPVRENLDGEIVILSPVETPLRQMLPRGPGSGLSAKWKVQSSFGAGLGTLTTTAGTTNAVNTIVVANARGFFAGEQVLFNSAYHTISSINYSTNVITVGASPGTTLNSQTAGLNVIKSSLFWPEQGVAGQMFYSETGAPASATTVYADKSADYKLLGTMGDVTMFAMAAGANFMNQYEVEKRNTLYRALLKEEYALLHAETGVTTVPWGDGTNALAYQGLIPFIRANAPAVQRQTAVGTLTIESLQTQLSRVWYQGGRGMFIMLSGREAETLTYLATNAGSYRVVITQEGGISLGGKVAKLIHAVSGEEVPIYVHPFMPQGTILFGAMRNQEGQKTAEVEVLPQVQTPESAFTEGQRFEGYYAQEIAPDASAPELLRFKIACYSVPKWRNAVVWGLSEGVTP